MDVFSTHCHFLVCQAFSRSGLLAVPTTEMEGLPSSPQMPVLAGLGHGHMSSDGFLHPARHTQTAVFSTEEAEPGPLFGGTDVLRL